MTDSAQSDSKTLAIIKGVRFGVGDRGSVTLSFSVYTTESSAALQVFNAAEGASIIQAYGVERVEQLENKPCWVDTSEPTFIRWIGPWEG
jgi:hypothetical protein